MKENFFILITKGLLILLILKYYKCLVQNEDLIIHDNVVNPHNFNYILNPGHHVCGPDQGESVKLLIYNHTSPSNFARRMAIRETWAKRSMFRDLRLVFMIGETKENISISQLKLEFNYFNDIVQENFHDSYKNLTYKGIMALKWISSYCNNAHYLYKTDDDIITNTFKLLRRIKTLGDPLKHPKNVFCKYYKNNGMIVMRNPSSKWYLSPDEYKFNRFGAYCSGSAFLLTKGMASLMFDISQYIKIVWVDDYYLTGLLVRGINGTYNQMRSVYIIQNNLVELMFNDDKKYRIVGHLGHLKTVKNIYNIWRNVLKSELNNHPELINPPMKLIDNWDFGFFEFKWGMEMWQNFYEIYFPKTNSSLTLDDY